MAVIEEVPRTQSIANGVTTVFPYGFMIPVVDDLVVSVDGVPQTGGFSVSGLGNGAGNIIFASAPAVGATVLIKRSTRLERKTDYQQAGDFFAATVNPDFDRQVYALQEMRDDLDSIVVDAIAAAIAGAIPVTIAGHNVISIFEFMTTAEQAHVLARDGSFDCTAVMQSAHETGDAIYYPAGLYPFDKVSFVSGGVIGTGKGLSVLQTSNLAADDVITCTGTGGGLQVPTFADFTLSGSLSKTSGAGIRSIAASAELSYPIFRDLLLDGLPTGIHMSAASQFHMRGLDVINYRSAGICVENINVADSGDSFMTECFLNTSVGTGTTYGIWHRSSSGLKISNIKILGGDSGYVLGWTAAGNGADVMLSNSSIEGCSNFPVFLGRDSGTGLVGAVQIQGCQLGATRGIATDVSRFLTKLIITGNHIEVLADDAACISLNGVNNLLVGPNVLQTHGNGLAYGISAQNCANGKITPQVHIATPPANRISMVNSPSVIVDLDRQSGKNVSVTTAAATTAASFYTGMTAVVFSTPFAIVPVVTANVGSAGGGFSAVPEAVTQFGFNFRVYGLSNGGVVTNCTWCAEGIV